MPVSISIQTFHVPEKVETFETGWDEPHGTHCLKFCWNFVGTPLILTLSHPPFQAQKKSRKPLKIKVSGSFTILGAT